MLTQESGNVAKIIRTRQTSKVLGDPSSPIVFPSSVLDSCNQKVHEAIATAGWAPFHYDRGIGGIAEPWRVHMLDCETCRIIATEFPTLFDDLKPSNKLPAMLSACGTLLLVNWLPQFRNAAVTSSVELPLEKKQQIDDEHLSATAAMIQNLLLLLTADGLGTYWSSGGQLGSLKMFDRLGISTQERLVGAIFVEYPDGAGPIVDRIAGKNRSRRSKPAAWVSEITL